MKSLFIKQNIIGIRVIKVPTKHFFRGAFFCISILFLIAVISSQESNATTAKITLKKTISSTAKYPRDGTTPTVMKFTIKENIPPTTTFNREEANCTNGKRTQDDLQQMAYVYLKNISQITMEENLTMLNDTLKTFEIPPDFQINCIQVTWPYLIPKSFQVPPKNVIWKGFQLPVITGLTNGRLGNVMGEYATLYALGRLYNATVLLHPMAKMTMHKMFPYLTMKDLPVPSANWTPETSGSETNWTILYRQDSYYNYNALEFAAAGLFGPNLFVSEGYPFEIHLFDFFREEIIKEFSFSDDLISEANKYLCSVKEDAKRAENASEFTFVGFHIRRTDYLNHIKDFEGELPGELFYERALQYYRKKYTSPIFIAASDDRDYLKKALNGSDIFYAPGKSRESDMALLTSCNHSIFTVGSYGFWTAYLTGGEVIYPDIHTKKFYCFSKPNYDKARLKFFTPLNSY